MAFLQCPNSECGSHGPFEVTDLPDENGHPAHKVLQCPLCNTVIAVLESGGQEMKFPPEYERAIMRLETSMRAIQSNLMHLRGQLATLQGRMARR
jgi:hypothetical protein